MWTVLSVAYAMAGVGPDAVGGAEQVLTQLDEALTRAGHRSVVIASEGSCVTGTLIGTPRVEGEITQAARERAWAEHRRAIGAALARYDVDLIHAHGVDFHRYLPAPGVPVLATLHLPAAWYPPRVFRGRRPGTYLNCVSSAQSGSCPECEQLVGWVANGVEGPPAVRHARRGYALMLGRICPEKGFHLGLDAARAAGVVTLLGGRVYPYPAHERYFREEIAPRLGNRGRFLGPVGLRRKRRLLAGARCVLVPSLAPETSSLVAMEALACGTPVVAFSAGALPEIVEHGRTGFIVEDPAGMAEAIGWCDAIDPEECRAVARERFSVDAMVRGYFALYEEVLARSGRGGRGRATAA